VGRVGRKGIVSRYREEGRRKKRKTHLIIVILVTSTRLNQHIERLHALLRLTLERRLGSSVLKNHLVSSVIPELERRKDLAEVGAGLFEDGLDGFEGRDGDDGDVDGLEEGKKLSRWKKERRKREEERTLGNRGVMIETPVTIPRVPSAPIKSCLRS
jgi:hypothetical protein